MISILLFIDTVHTYVYILYLHDIIYYTVPIHIHSKYTNYQLPRGGNYHQMRKISTYWLLATLRNNVTIVEKAPP